MLLRQFLLFLILVFCVCCGDVAGLKRWENLPIGIAVTTDEQREVLYLYNEMFGSEIFVEDAGGVEIEDVESIELEGGPPDVRGLANLEYDSSGIYSAEILIKQTPVVVTYQKVLAHELGHVLGLVHSESGLMEPDMDIKKDLDYLMDENFLNSVIDLYPELESYGDSNQN